ncbi:PTS system mannose/fructose/N-acetylgalactosamine-transporter subunit IIB [Tannockella kyphosi]|uniref:PTS system mannose/fructose/N-acetylgalactosamine-transporter subunit IIB n=1 Tax=Tannockella kyphosi TaxID=2899121 RepID=UPI0020122F9D|nr:PTS sugar transporter subunit IIB [Tannockella kyphosi]
MISMMRVDDRLIHGQVAVMWSKELEIQRIIVASDKIASNTIQVSALKMAAPAGVKAVALPIVKAAEILKDPRSASMKILVISNDPKDLLEVIKLIDDKPILNIANYGRIGSKSLSSKTRIAESVYLTEEDIKVVNEILECGIDIIHQPLPSSNCQKFKELMGGN